MWNSVKEMIYEEWNQSLNLKSIRLWGRVDSDESLRNEGFAKCFESTLIWGEPIRFWEESKRLLLNRFALPSSRFSEKVFPRDIV
ncbi:hypothetical protein PIB30_040696 [Stylosanthes scabra]|uniref:Uncharacterized protein n=1 Tax=Stylosanthes scabra TaxID=79078 RepID=A0ABU6RET2_9FABA|nr:hypothetical protein [Stylosanthes scabra]